MSSRKTLALGIAALLTIGALAYVAFNGQSLVGFARAEYEAEVASAVGVNRYSSDVRVRGVRVGEVTSVDTTETSALVRFRISSDVELHSDASAALRLKNILGEKYLELDPGESDEPLEGPIPLAATETSTDLGAIVGNVTDPLLEYTPEKIEQARAEAHALVDEHAPTAAELLAGVRDVLDRVNADSSASLGVIDDIDTLLATLAASRDHISQTANNVEALATDMTAFLESYSPDLLRILVDSIAVRAVLGAHAADIAATGAEVPVAIDLARTLVAYLVDNLENGGHPLPIGITNFGPALARDYGAPADGGGS